MTHNGDEVTMGTGLDAKDAEAVVDIVERHPLNNPSEHFLVGLDRGRRYGHGADYRQPAVQAPEGEEMYKRRCSSRHDERRPRVRPVSVRLRSAQSSAASTGRSSIFD